MVGRQKHGMVSNERSLVCSIRLCSYFFVLDGDIKAVQRPGAGQRIGKHLRARREDQITVLS